MCGGVNRLCLPPCALVYGQTGSGKTHTMFGGGDAVSQWEERGVIPRACEEVLEAAAARTALGGGFGAG